MSGPTRSALRLGILVPCRNEARVIERKLANVACGDFPSSDRPHRVVVVDDGSDDGTAACALRAAPALAAAGLELRVVANAVRPGKPGAIRQGLAEFGDTVDLVVLTDADVVVDPLAWRALECAFNAEPSLAMACGVQRFVHELPADGSCPTADGRPPVDAGSAYDHWTARVRAFESRFGRLFSVHGQLLAWRRDLDLVPALGIAADDLDLMFQVRARTHEPRRVRCFESARFFEVKTAPGNVSKEQALRRARAYVQVVRASRSPAGAVDRLHWSFYRYVPSIAPELSIAIALGIPVVLWIAVGPWFAIASVVGIVACALTPTGRRWRALMRVIREARTLEKRSALPERWEMVRR